MTDDIAAIAAGLAGKTRENLASGKFLSLGSLLDLALTDSRLLNEQADGLSDLGISVRQYLLEQSHD